MSTFVTTHYLWAEACSLVIEYYMLTSLWFEGFLELINNMLTSGMVPALYPDEEKEAIVGQVPA